MAKEQNTLLRVLVPILMGGLILVLGWAVMRNSMPAPKPAPDPAKTAATPSPAPAPTPTNSTPPTQASQPAPAQTADSSAATPTQTASEAASPTSPGPTTPLTTLTTPTTPTTPPAGAPPSAKPWPAGTPQAFSKLGELTRGGPYKALIEFSPIGAGIERVTMADHFTSPGPGAQPQVALETVRIDYPVAWDAQGAASSFVTRTITPFSLLGLTIDGAFVNLAASPQGPLWRELEPGKFEAQIVDAAGAPLGRVIRTFKFETGAYNLELDQRFENLSDRALSVSWLQIGPVEPPVDLTLNYDARRVRLGCIGSPASDPEQTVVVGDTGTLIEHITVVGTPTFQAQGFVFPEKILWPEARFTAREMSLSWVAATNRYFAVAAHALPERQARRSDTPSKAAPDKRLLAAAQVDRLVLTPPVGDQSKAVHDARIGLRLASAAVSVAPGRSTSQPLGLYAGPISRGQIEKHPELVAVGLGDLLIYYTGGPCWWCMFQPVANLLHDYLGLVHWLTGDWGIAIVLLVLTIRVLLHPVTRMSQRRMLIFGKQMAALAPRQQKLKEKYGNDEAKLREEMAKLMRDSGVDYKNAAIGCVPGFMQTPVWIALSAMITFSFELRHSPALFGAFQHVGALFGGYWGFLADLSDQDRFIPIPTVTIPIVGWQFHSLNLLPALLGVVFYMQQKYLQPPQTTQLTPEQEQQQRMMKVMMVVLFPLFMYTSPAALVLYFMVSSVIASLEAKHIRASVERRDAERKAKGEPDPDLPPALTGAATVVRAHQRGQAQTQAQAQAAKPLGFMDRIRQYVEQAQKLKEEQDRKTGKSRSR